MKKVKSKAAHTAHTKYGMGDHYGTGIRAKIGRMRDSFSPGFVHIGKAKLKRPPKTVV